MRQVNPRAFAREIEPIVNTVLLATAHAQVLREKCDKIQRRLLDSGRYGGDCNPDHVYLLPDEAAARYFADLDAAYREAGWTDLEPGYCPALMAESLQRDAERALIESARVAFPDVTVDRLLCAPRGLERLREYLDLLIKLVVNRDGYRAPSIP
jgi:hypothetical protein